MAVLTLGDAWAGAVIVPAPLVVGPGCTNAPGPELPAQTVYLRWQPVTNATGYQIFTRDLTTRELNEYDAFGSSTGKFLVLISGRPYRWNMVALNGTNESALSQTMYFRVKLIPSYPSIREVSPFPAPALDKPQVITIHGYNFQPSCRVTLRLEDTGETFPNITPNYCIYRCVTITRNLTSAPGRWSVEVINPGGFASGKSIFSVVPAEEIRSWRWWRSGWPWTYAALGLLSIAGGGWWWTARRRLPRRIAEAQRQTQLEERERLVRNLHDRASADITHLAHLADLTLLEFTSLPAETQRRLREVHTAARDAETAPSDLLFAAAPQNEWLPQLAAHVRQRVQERLKPHGMELEFSSRPTPVPNRPLDAVACGQLLYICHEVLNNIVKHAQATTVGVHLEVEEDQLALRFSDNGRGFQPEAQPTGRHGLSNLRERALRLRGFLEVESAPGKGTRVTVRLPLDRDEDVTGGA